jgi:ribosomal protein S18 acetylase RimI-like enzyme
MHELRAAAVEDIDHIVRVHLTAFPGFFLTLLGARFLRELYSGFILDENGICLVAERDGEMSGFVVGTSAPEDFFRRMFFARWHAFLFAALGALLRRPWFVARRLASALGYRGEKPTAHPGGALLSSIAVIPEEAGTGVGRALVDAFCQHVVASRESFVYLITDRDGNDSVNRFYLQAGFSLESSFSKAGNRWMNRYTKKLT